MVIISPCCAAGSQPSLATQMRKQGQGEGWREMHGDAEWRPPLRSPMLCPHPGSAGRQMGKSRPCPEGPHGTAAPSRSPVLRPPVPGETPTELHKASSGVALAPCRNAAGSHPPRGSGALAQAGRKDRQGERTGRDGTYKKLVSPAAVMSDGAWKNNWVVNSSRVMRWGAIREGQGGHGHLQAEDAAINTIYTHSR